MKQPSDHCQKCKQLVQENESLNQQIGVLLTEKQLFQDRNADIERLVNALEQQLYFQNRLHEARLSETIASYQHTISANIAERDSLKLQLNIIMEQMNYYKRELERYKTNVPTANIIPNNIPDKMIKGRGIDDSKRKTRLCKEWSFNGTCSHSTHCAFAHGQNELRLKQQ